MLAKDFSELDVYKMAFEAAMRIFELTQAFPKEERYSLTDQIRRSSRSVCANIGEGWRKRRYKAAFVSKLSDAETEAAETQVWLDFANACRYLPPSEHRLLRERYDHILGKLTNMMAQAERWTLRVKDEVADYGVSEAPEE